MPMILYFLYQAQNLQYGERECFRVVIAMLPIITLYLMLANLSVYISLQRVTIKTTRRHTNILCVQSTHRNVKAVVSSWSYYFT